MLHSGTVPQRGGISVNMREALAGGARWAGREFLCLSGEGNVALVMGDVKRPSPRPRCRGTATVPWRWCLGTVAVAVGTAPVRWEEAIMLQHRACSQRMPGAGGGVSSRPDAWAHPEGHRRKMCCGVAWPAGFLGQGWAYELITQEMQREGLRKGDGSELHFETKHNCTGKRAMVSLARAGSAKRLGRETRRPDAARQPVPFQDLNFKRPKDHFQVPQDTGPL